MGSGEGGWENTCIRETSFRTSLACQIKSPENGVHSDLTSRSYPQGNIIVKRQLIYQFILDLTPFVGRCYWIGIQPYFHIYVFTLYQRRGFPSGLAAPRVSSLYSRHRQRRLCPARDVSCYTYCVSQLDDFNQSCIFNRFNYQMKLRQNKKALISQTIQI